MLDERQPITTENSSTPRWIGLAVLILAGLSIAGVAIGWNASSTARTTEQGLTNEVKALQQKLDVVSQRLAQAEERGATAEGQLAVVTDKMKLTEGEVARARGQAKQIRSEYSKQIADMESSVKSELATKASSDDVKALGTDVGGVRQDLDATKQHLSMTRGELGTLIARNSEEIEQLRRLGQRDYFEFSLDKKGTRQRLGSVTVELRGTNTKRNHFTLALNVDDMRLEKKNRAVNEPIYFYAQGYRAPLELVVNKVGKDRVTGYLSVPKGPLTASASSSN